MAPLPLNTSVEVNINLPAAGNAQQTFDVGLIMGESTVITTNERVVFYDNLAAMVADGFSTVSPEYLAATKYFSAISKPKRVAIGVKDTGETALEAFTACREASQDWYAGYCCDISNSDKLAIAAYTETLTSPFTIFILDSDDPDVKNGVGDNLFEELNDANYRRTFGLFSETNYAGAAVLGYAMGANKQNFNSAYTLKFKALPGVDPDTLTTTQVNDIQVNKGNVYVLVGKDYDWLQQGTMFDGSFFDEINGLDQLCNKIQTNVATLLYTSPKIPQTELGIARLRSVIGNACQDSVNTGFLAPGKWNGAEVLGLKTGDFLPAGYLVQSESIADQAQADRENRDAPPIYVAVKEAGAVHYVLITVDVNR
jgi:hypothetical protein